jgi:hypothetical protein
MKFFDKFYLFLHNKKGSLMKKLFVVLFLSRNGKVLLKRKEKGEKIFLGPLYAWQRRGESDLGTIKRIVSEIEHLAPPQTFKIRFHYQKELQIKTKFGPARKIWYFSRLPFEPYEETEGKIVIVNIEDLAKFRNEIPNKDYLTILEILKNPPVQLDLTDLL